MSADKEKLKELLNGILARAWGEMQSIAAQVRTDPLSGAIEEGLGRVEEIIEQVREAIKEANPTEALFAVFVWDLEGDSGGVAGPTPHLREMLLFQPPREAECGYSIERIVRHKRETLFVWKQDRWVHWTEGE